MRDWRLQAPVKVIEKVKVMLLAEQAQAPVDHVGKMGRSPKIEETGVLVPAQAKVGALYVFDGKRTRGIEETGMLVPGQGIKVGIGGAEQGGGVEEEEIEEKGKGKSGWLKLKSR